MKQVPLSMAQSYLLVMMPLENNLVAFESLENVRPLLFNNSHFWQLTKGVIRRKENDICLKIYIIGLEGKTSSKVSVP